jgi:hypothetical protein
MTTISYHLYHLTAAGAGRAAGRAGRLAGEAVIPRAGASIPTWAAWASRP